MKSLIIYTVAIMSVLNSSQASSFIFVAKDGMNIPPFETWQNAAREISDAVALANDGDTVLVSNGLFEVIAPVMVNRGTTIQAINGPQYTTIHGSYTSACFQIMHSNAVVDGFTITGGRGVLGMGGGVFMSEGATLQNCVVTGNVSTLFGGGGIYLNIGGTVSNCVIANNTAAEGGDGGGIYMHRDGRLINSVVRDNQARVGGGVAAFYFNVITGTEISGNQADQGGGLFISHRSRIANSRIINNHALRGGGICGFLGGEILNTALSNNTALADMEIQRIESADNKPCIDDECTGLPLLSPQPGAIAYHVGLDGNDANDGLSTTSAFRTIQRAANILAAENTLFIGPGIYREYVVFRGETSILHGAHVLGASPTQTIVRSSDIIHSWTLHTNSIWKIEDWPVSPQQIFADEINLKRLGWPNYYIQTVPFTYTPYGTNVSQLIPGSFFYDVTGRTVYARFPSDAGPETFEAIELSTRVHAVDALFSSGLTLERIGFEHANTFSHSPGGWSMLRMPPAGILKDSRVVWSDGEGVGLNNGSKVISSEISYHGMSGLNMTINGHVRDCRIVSNTYRPFNPDWNSGGIRVIQPFCVENGGAAGGVIENNEVAWNRGYGIWFDQSTGNYTRIVRNNYVHHNTKAGIMFEISRGGHIYNNLIVSNFSGGIWISGTDDVSVYNNTLAHNSGYVDLYLHGVPRQLCDINGEITWASITSNTFINNVIYESQCTFTVGLPPDSTNPLQRVGGNILNHNLFYRTGNPIRLSVAGVTYVDSIVAWNQLTGHESNGLDIPPRLGPDFRPQAESPLIDAGSASLYPAQDRNSVRRPLKGNPDALAAPDIGAFEYVALGADTDGDGVTDEHELIAGTDPVDSSSWLKITTNKDAETKTIAWPGAPGRIYNIERSTNLMIGFIKIWTNIPAALPVTTFMIHDHEFGEVYYRIEVQR